MTDLVERLREGIDPLDIPDGERLMDEAAAEIARLRVIEDAAIDAATYFHMGGCGEEDFDEQHMVNLMTRLGRALEPKP